MNAGAIRKARDRLEMLITVVGADVAATKKNTQHGHHYLDHEKYTTWRVSALTAIKSLAPGSHFEVEFQAFENKGWNPSQKFTSQLAVLKALLDDLDGGHLVNLRGLIRAEVFGELLDQARHLYDEGYWQPAAVVAGAVLEDHLRKLCAKHASIALGAKPKLDSMNSELAKAGEYDVLVQKRVTVWADVRNKAAHGRWTEFVEADVDDLLKSVLRFLVEHPT